MVEAKTALIELQYFPNLQYFSKFLLYDKVCIESQEHYQKGSYRNRCHIATVNGLLRLSIPLHKGKNQQTPIKEVRLSTAEEWQRIHWRSIKTAYGNAPFFEYYADTIQPMFFKKYDFLFDFNLDLLQVLLKIIAPSQKFSMTKTYSSQQPNDVEDLRNNISPKSNKQGMDPYFRHPIYTQLFEDKQGFIPNLSILDALFCTGPEVGLLLKNANVKSP